MFHDADHHIHSWFSDGDQSPESLVDRYIAKGYRSISITDHDEIEGSRAAVSYAAGKDITVIPGIEISTRDVFDNEIHMLGYFIDYDSPVLQHMLHKVSMWRAERNDQLLQVLAEMGIDIPLDELFAVNEGRYIGKPTIARVMMAHGLVGSVDEAFNGIYRDERIRAVRKKNLSTAEAVEVIHNSGGVAVFAHPMETRRRGEGEDFWQRFDGIMEQMLELKIDGIECYHPSASEIESERLRLMADRHGLIITRGSDFHSDQSRRSYEG